MSGSFLRGVLDERDGLVAERDVLAAHGAGHLAATEALRFGPDALANLTRPCHLSISLQPYDIATRTRRQPFSHGIAGSRWRGGSVWTTDRSGSTAGCTESRPGVCCGHPGGLSSNGHAAC